MRYEAQREARAAAHQTPRSSILASSSHLQRIDAFNAESDRRRASEIQVFAFTTQSIKFNLFLLHRL